MEMYLGELEIRNYTLTVLSESEEKIQELMKKEWAKWKKNSGAFLSWDEKKEDLQIVKIELNKIEWR